MGYSNSIVRLGNICNVDDLYSTRRGVEKLNIGQTTLLRQINMEVDVMSGFPFVSEVFFFRESYEWSMLEIMLHIVRLQEK